MFLIPTSAIIFIKVMGVTSGLVATGFGINAVRETGILKGAFYMIEKIKSIPFVDNEHVSVMGITRHGKTWAIIRSLEKHNGAVFFYNVNDETVKGFIRVTNKDNVGDMIQALKKGKKINFVPTGNLENDSKNLGTLINYIFEYVGELNCIFAIDEVHLLSQVKEKSGLKACQRIATTGLRRGMKGIFITQRGALIDNTLFTQSTRVICFALGHADITYLKGHGIPTEEIKQRTRQEKYLFVDYDLKNVKGPYKIF